MNAHELPILLDRASELPLAAQLATALRRAILGGILRHDEALPSTRALAASVRVSRGTVVAAYDQLAGEGYLLARPGSATRVMVERHDADLPAPAAARNPTPRGVRSGQVRPRPPLPPPLIDLAPGHPSTRTLVDPAWTAAWRAAVAASGRSDSPPACGTLELRTAIAEHVRRARGLACRPDDVIVTAGTSDALATIGLAVAAVAGGADGSQAGTHSPRIAVEDPGYPTARRVLRPGGAHLAAGAHRRERPRSGRARRARPDAARGAGHPSHQYPLGSSLSVQSRLDLLDWARAADAVVIEDDYDSEFRFDDHAAAGRGHPRHVWAGGAGGQLLQDRHPVDPLRLHRRHRRPRRAPPRRAPRPRRHRLRRAAGCARALPRRAAAWPATSPGCAASTRTAAPW